MERRHWLKKRTSGATWRRTDLGFRASLLFALLVVLACSAAPEEVPSVDTGSTDSTRQPERQSRLRGETSHPQPISIAWADTRPSLRGNRLHPRFINATDHDITIDLKVLAVDPTGRHVERSLGAEMIAAKSSRVIPVDVADLPAQSSGAATVIQVAAEYDVEAPIVGAASAATVSYTSRKVLALAPARYVTFDEGFTVASIRSMSTQIKESDRLAAGSAKRPVLSGLRIFDSKTKQMRGVDPNALDESGKPRGIISVSGMSVDQMRALVAAAEGR